MRLTSLNFSACTKSAAQVIIWELRPSFAVLSDWIIIRPGIFLPRDVMISSACSKALAKMVCCESEFDGWSASRMA